MWWWRVSQGCPIHISICRHTKEFDMKNLSRNFCSHYSHPPPFQLVEILPTILPPRLACQACQPRHLHGASRFQAHLIFDIFGRTIFCLKICAQKLHKFQHNLHCHAQDCIFYICFSDKKGNFLRQVMPLWQKSCWVFAWVYYKFLNWGNSKSLPE